MAVLGKMPRWKQWILRNVIGPVDVVVMTKITPKSRGVVKFGKPGAYNTVEPLIREQDS